MGQTMDREGKKDVSQVQSTVRAQIKYYGIMVTFLWQLAWSLWPMAFYALLACGGGQ